MRVISGSLRRCSLANMAALKGNSTGSSRISLAIAVWVLAQAFFSSAARTEGMGEFPVRDAKWSFSLPQLPPLPDWTKLPKFSLPSLPKFSLPTLQPFASPGSKDQPLLPKPTNTLPTVPPGFTFPQLPPFPPFSMPTLPARTFVFPPVNPSDIAKLSPATSVTLPWRTPLPTTSVSTVSWPQPSFFTRNPTSAYIFPGFYPQAPSGIPSTATSSTIGRLQQVDPSQTSSFKQVRTGFTLSESVRGSCG